MVAPAIFWLKNPVGVQFSPPPLRLPRTRAQQKEREPRARNARNSSVQKMQAGGRVGEKHSSLSSTRTPWQRSDNVAHDDKGVEELVEAWGEFPNKAGKCTRLVDTNL